jgi:hypothetical protein
MKSPGAEAMAASGQIEPTKPSKLNDGFLIGQPPFAGAFGAAASRRFRPFGCRRLNESNRP